MCGFAGYFGALSSSTARPVLSAMGDAIGHRGPDDAGLWLEEALNIGLIHRRLSILDLSPAGHQPMISRSERYVLVFNGEIYNFREIVKEIEARGGYPWKGHSDTEVMLAAFEAWGIEESLQRFVGMFAFALLDRVDRCLYLCSDRFGEKPLYFGWADKTFLFGSELKALRTHPAWSGKIDRSALALLMRHNCIPAPYSIFEGFSKALPGTLLRLDLSRTGSRTSPDRKAYWRAAQMVTNGRSSPFSGSESEAVGELDRLLRQAVAGQMVADVPLGAFLSGGVDSSTIVALMQAMSTRPVRTFSIGFNEQGYDEAVYAKAVARHLGTDHTELYVTSEQTRAVIPYLPTIYDEPFADSSQIPTYLVSKLAREHVAVSLSGDAGDELFGGYNRYFLASKIWSRISPLPFAARSTLAASLTMLSPLTWTKLLNSIGSLAPKQLRSGIGGDRLHKLAAILAVRSPAEMYMKGFSSHWDQPSDIVIDGIEPLTTMAASEKDIGVDNFVESMMFLDLINYLPNDILVKVDRAAMAVSLETRIPFLDHRVAEFAWRLPLSMKVRDGQGKWILRQVLDQYIPRQLIERPKMGFGVPIDSWLRGPLRDWAEELLSEARLQRQGYFKPAPIRQKWAEHLSGKRNWQYHLWDVLMFQAWLEHQ